MPDVWSTVTQLDLEMQERLAAVLETRGADPQQQSMRQEFLAGIDFPKASRALEVGCGTGVLTRMLAQLPFIAAVVGVDPAATLVDKARELSAHLPQASFQEGDGRALEFTDGAFDVVVFDSTLCHIPGPEQALAEAFRVLRSGGVLAVFDGDYATTTVALSTHDPLQSCVDAMVANSVNDRFLVRRLPTLVRVAGFETDGLRSHGFVETRESSYMLTIVDRGVDILHAHKTIDDTAAKALKAEARRRVSAGTFFGHISYGSLVARKPGAPTSDAG